MSSLAGGGRFRQRFRKHLNRLRSRSRDPSKDASHDSILAGPGVPEPHLHSVGRNHGSPEQSITTGDVPAQTQIDQLEDTATSSAHARGIEPDPSLGNSSILLDIRVDIVSSDLWSAAYREAVDGLGKDVNIAILKGDSLAQLFKQLESLDKDASQESAFLRGVRYLHSLQIPLERFKLALDLASPLTSMEPTVATVFGVVKGVTAIAITFSTADLQFAKQIGEMLEQLSYIDDCDTLGQKSSKKDIHKALVVVYQKLLEFYNAAFEILSRKGAKLVMKIILENDRLPGIVKEFLKHADFLRQLVQKATWEIAEDIKAMLYDHAIASWLGSGKMTRQNQHHANQQDIRVDQACEFLLADPNFMNWYHSTHSQQLVILGDMGSGKTVAMAFLIDELRRRNEHELPQPKLCYHYCQNDETGRAVYVFSSLILSLLEQLPGLKKTFFEWHKQMSASGIEAATNFKKLEEWLQKTLETLDRPLHLVIDGLDECDRLSRDCLLKSFKNLSRTTPRLKVILSSRPEEEILEQLSGIPMIPMATDAKRDRLIVEQTVERQLSPLSKDVKALVIETLSQLAQGSAIWTKMIVALIEVRRIRALGPMRAFLKDMPQPRELSELYASLFSRYTSDDPENQRLATTALEILAVSRRPLSILELAWAVALGAAQEAIPTVVALAEWVDHQRVMSLIQPFVAHVDFSDLRKRQVRLVHQSVKEFITGVLGPSGPVLQILAISSPAAPNHEPLSPRTESLEAVILGVCIKYLLLEDIGDIDLFSEEHVAIQELPQDADLFCDNDEPNDYDRYCTWEAWEQNMIHYDPTERGFGELFVYASCYWIEHFGAVSIESLQPRLGNIDDLCQAGSTRLHNWITQHPRPDCTVKPRFEFDSSLYDPLSITCLYGSEAMLQNMLEQSDFDRDIFLPNPAMGAADQILQWGDLSRLRLLWRSKLGSQIRNFEFFRLAVRRWSNRPYDKHRPGWDVVFDLVEDVLDIMVKERWGSRLLCLATTTACMPAIQAMMDRAQHNSGLRNELLDVSQSEHGLVGLAVLGNHVDVVEYLLGQQGIEAHLHKRNTHGENVLHMAARLCNLAMFQLLVPRLRDSVHQMDDQNDTVLIRTITSSSAYRDRGEAVRILLSEGPAIADGHFVDEINEARRIADGLGEASLVEAIETYAASWIQVGKVNESE